MNTHLQLINTYNKHLHSIQTTCRAQPIWLPQRHDNTHTNARPQHKSRGACEGKQTQTRCTRAQRLCGNAARKSRQHQQKPHTCVAHRTENSCITSLYAQRGITRRCRDRRTPKHDKMHNSLLINACARANIMHTVCAGSGCGSIFRFTTSSCYW